MAQPAALIRQLIGFGATGVITLSTILGVTALLHRHLGLGVEAAYAGGYLSAIIIAYVICRYVVFDAVDVDPVSQFTRFLVSSLMFRAMEWLATILLYRLVDLPYLVAPAIIVAVSFFGKFFFYRANVFAGKP